MALLLLAAQASAADEPEIAVEASASEIFIGESVDYVVEIRNVKNPPAPDLSALRQDFDVVATGDESHNQSSTFIFNGKVTQQNSFGHAFRFRLTPKRTGKLVIPAPSATIDGKTVTGEALALNVIAPEAQDLVVPEIKTDRAEGLPHAAVRGDAPRARPPLAGRPRSRPSGARCAAALRTSTSTGSICRQD